MEVAALAVVPAHLPQTGDSWPHREASLAPGNAGLILPERGGPRPDQAHLSEGDIEQLGKLVDVHLPQPASEFRDPRIAGNLELRAIHQIERREISLGRVSV